MKRVIALLTLLLLLITPIGGNLFAEEDPMLNGGGGALGGGGGVEDEPDDDDHPWGGDQLPGGEKDITTIRVIRTLSVTLTGLPQLDYFLTGMYLRIYREYTFEATPVTKYYTRKSR